MALAGVGTLLSILGMYAVRTEEDATQRTLLQALARGINLSTVLIIVAALGLTWWLLPAHWPVGCSVIAGLVAGGGTGASLVGATAALSGPAANLGGYAVEQMVVGSVQMPVMSVAPHMVPIG